MSSLLTFTNASIVVAHLVAGLVSLYALAWFTDALDRASASRRFEAVVAALILAGPLTFALLLLKLAAAPARSIIARRGAQ